jgi:hypothetical protein
MGKRKRYLLVEVERALEFFGGNELPLLREHYESRIREWIERGRLARQPWWTESVAVGNAAFVQQVESLTSWRRRMELQEMDPGFWSLREDPAPWLAGDRQA